jgi:hypothetical protein
MADYRQIVEHPEFTAARRALDIDVKLLDEILEGVIGVIARIPETFGRVEYTKKLRSVATRDWTQSGKPRFIVYFSFDKETVTLEYIHRHELDDRDYP